MFFCPSIFVMAGLDPAIHERLRGRSVDNRAEPAHDDKQS